MDKQHFMKKLTFLLEKLDFNENVKAKALYYICDNYSDICKQTEGVHKREWYDYLINKKDPYTSLMILIYKIVELNIKYTEKGLPINVLIDTLSDLTLRQRMYFEQNNKLGLSEEDLLWLKHIYCLNIFKLGSLQYELGNMNYSEFAQDKRLSKVANNVPNGSNILKIHIRRGVDLSPKSVDLSFEISKNFFKTYYKDYKYKAYTCSSWMLYSKNNKIFSPNSNILNFCNRFELFYELPDKEMAIKYIFGEGHKNVIDYPQRTSLQKNALKDLNNLGIGYGVIYIKEEE